MKFNWYISSSGFRLKFSKFQIPWSFYSAFMLTHFSCVWLFVIPWTVAHQAPLSMGILQARILEWVGMPSSRGFSQPRVWTPVSHNAGEFFTIWGTREVQVIHYLRLNVFVSISLKGKTIVCLWVEFTMTLTDVSPVNKSKLHILNMLICKITGRSIQYTETSLTSLLILVSK